MMGLSLGHIIVVVALIVILFGRGAISSTMKDVGQSIKQLRGIAHDV